MEALQLFTIETRRPAIATTRTQVIAGHERDDAVWHETELFLADHLERYPDLAQIQAALALCDAAGDRDRSTLAQLVLDRRRFPRSVHAIARVTELLELPRDERPEGFWPRFLLEQLEDRPSH
jgi:hypothetical protein